MSEHEIRVIRPTKGDRLDEWLLVTHPDRVDVASDTLVKMFRELTKDCKVDVVLARRLRTRIVPGAWMTPDFSYLIPSHRDEPIDFVFATPSLPELAALEFKTLKARTSIADRGFQYIPFSFGDISP